MYGYIGLCMFIDMDMERGKFRGIYMNVGGDRN